MPKLHADFTAPLNLLVAPAMKQSLVALGYYRGAKGHFAGPTKDLIQDGLDRFIAGLSPVERKRFEEILESVRVAEAYRIQGQRAPG